MMSGVRKGGGGGSSSPAAPHTSSPPPPAPLHIWDNFDSGNLLKAEVIYPSNNHTLYTPENQDYEVNVWTRPDCYGTPFENGNRTWFHFGISGGKPGGLLKINILNLNKQTKLFVQGMQPVQRLLPSVQPRWERVADRVVVNENRPQENNGCSISFRVKLPESNSATLYVAFTYPFGYLELCDLLKYYESQFNSPTHGHGKINRKDLLLNPEDSSSSIYFHRECVIFSLEGRRVELLTISSMHGISGEREPALKNLFPIPEEGRPFRFPKWKKVVFLSARVHPGETPSTFVLNGLLSFILARGEPRAALLRRLFVFKVIPFLNPDGVYRGHYRTDPRGVNLNRVYLRPSLAHHPSIYAARKLLIYYHCGMDDVDVEEESPLQLGHSASGSDNLIKEANSCTGIRGCMEEPPGSGSALHKNEPCGGSSDKPYMFVLSDANSLCAGCVDEPAIPTRSNAKEVGRAFGGFSPEDSHHCAFESCDEDSVQYIQYERLRGGEEAQHVVAGMEVDQNMNSVEEEEEMMMSSPAGPAAPDTEPPTSSTASMDRDCGRERGRMQSFSRRVAITRAKSTSSIPAAASPTHKNKAEVCPRAIFSNADKPTESNTRVTRSQRKFPIPSSAPSKKDKIVGRGRYHEPSSGLFLYVDMHGHTTKRGIFMYGNHFPEIKTQAECMLVPRLMAINSPHFDFAGCNFTERLMCVKDKKDGLSREGSGRVACLKLTGLVRSYTLECNYNTGRVINQIVDGGAELNSFSPPKYTIEIFEGIGRSLAETLLDMSGQNPYSRLGSTEFKTVDGVKRSLIARLRLTPEFKAVISGSNPDITAAGISATRIPSPVVVVPSTDKPRKGRKTVLAPAVLPQSPGPLGPKNRENLQNKGKAGGSQARKKQLGGAVAVGGSTSLDYTTPTTNLPKSKLAKVNKAKKKKQILKKTK